MKPLSGRAFARQLEAKGWTLLRVNGSHHIYGKPGAPIRLSVPFHGSRPLKTGLQRYLMKMSGLTDADLG